MRWIISVFLYLTAALAVMAHDPGLSSASFVIHAESLELVTTFAEADARWFVPDQNGWPESRCTELGRRVSSAWSVMIGAKEVAPSSLLVTTAPGNNIVCTQRYALSRPGQQLQFSTRIFDTLPPGHRQHVSLSTEKGEILFASLLSQAEPVFATTLPSTFVPAAQGERNGKTTTISFTEFFRLGVEHILTGYDHLLFLFAFLVTAKTLRAVLKIVTSFTLAHSITLGLSALNVVYVSPAWVEPLIAATIVVVAVQNILRRGKSSERVMLTFAFGLIHGFGFASVLRDMGIASLGDSAWRALAGFNLGVEVGQLAVASMVLPLIWFLRARGRASFELRWAPAMSSAIAVAGTYWLIQRLG